MVRSHLPAYKRDSVIVTAAKAVKMFKKIEQGGASKSRGGFLTVRSMNSGLVLFIVPIGEFPGEKIEKYLNLSQEKAKRLLKNHYHLNHVSSWQSRNPDNREYGGAVCVLRRRGVQHILSFSGLPEFGDEAVSLFVAVREFSLSVPKALEIATISGNGYLPTLLKV